MKQRLIIYLLLCSMATFSTTAMAALSQDPALHWRTLYTTHFAIHFHAGEESLAQEVATIAERVHTRLSATFAWQPRERTQVMLTDRVDVSNGSASPLPRNEMWLIVTPPDGSSVIGDYDNWLELLITHEYTHILQLDKVGGLPQGLHKVFGRQLFLFPNLLQPAWLIEGLATHQETDKIRGIGRGQSAWFRMLMRLEVAHAIKPLRQVNQPLVSWPTGHVRYLYGAYFYQFIAERYGAGKVTELVEEYSDNLLPFAINTNSNKVLGKPLTPLWSEFSAYLQTQFTPEIQRIHQQGETTGRRLTHSGYFTGVSQVAANGDVYFTRQDLQSEPGLMRLTKDSQQIQRVANVRSRHFDLHPTAGIVLAELNAVRNTNLFSDLYHIDPASGRKTRLTRGGRYLYASWSPDGRQIIAVHNAQGQQALHLLDTHGKLLDTLWQGNDHTILSAPDWSPGGQHVVLSVWRPQTLWNLELFNIPQRHWQRLTHGPDIEIDPRFSTDGKAIVFSADYYTSFNDAPIFNLYRLTLTGSKLTRLSNVLGGAFAPALAADDNGLYYMGAGHNGFDLYHLAAPQAIPVPTTENTSQTNTEPVKPRGTIHAKIRQIEDYNALPLIAPTSWFPYLQFDDTHNEIGFTTEGADPLRRHLYNLLLAYDSRENWLAGFANYLYDRWNPTLKLSLSRQVLANLDNNNKIERYRNDDTFGLVAMWPFFSYERQWLLHLGVVGQWESDKIIRSNRGTAPTLRDPLAGIAVTLNTARRYPRSISPSYGRQLRLIAEDSDAFNSNYSGQTYTLDWREFIDLPGQHVLATRLVGGWGTGAPKPFRLGGSRETSISTTPEVAALAAPTRLFGQRRYPLRGYPEGRADLRGRRMALIEAEWRFPIALVERGFMSPPLGLHRLHGKLFHNWGQIWTQGNDIPSLRRSAGAELSTELILGYWLPLDLRLGYAKGFNHGGEDQVYLQLGASF
jgi:Tol biopolymer transport system component